MSQLILFDKKEDLGFKTSSLMYRESNCYLVKQVFYWNRGIF